MAGLCAIASLLSALPAAAATVTTTFPVSATVEGTCSISASNLAFGVYTGALLTAPGNLTITCTNTTPYSIGLNAGTGNGGTTTTRNMMGPGAQTLSYQMFRDAAYTLNWGNTTGADTYAGTGTGAGQSVVIYGRVPAAQAATPGSYSDTITATLTY